MEIEKLGGRASFEIGGLGGEVLRVEDPYFGILDMLVATL